ncbi:hypothetical protein GCM10022267_84860 [Lentzea roselyniae]|uniref:Uncharacterized protein n=1 Tax=Lentzea roselyniae TaxID=531940 RepID=A0ABP7CD73_9PSEU
MSPAPAGVLPAVETLPIPLGTHLDRCGDVHLQVRHAAAFVSSAHRPPAVAVGRDHRDQDDHVVACRQLLRGALTRTAPRPGGRTTVRSIGHAAGEGGARSDDSSPTRPE